MTGRSYNKPRSINFVSVFVVLLLAAGGYAGYKFIPVWWQGQKVDGALDDIKTEVANISQWTSQQRWQVENKIQAKAIAAIHNLGINDEPDQPVEVWFSADYQYLQAKYMVVVQHPFGKTTKVTMNRKVKIPVTKAL